MVEQLFFARAGVRCLSSLNSPEFRRFLNSGEFSYLISARAKNMLNTAVPPTFFRRQREMDTSVESVSGSQSVPSNTFNSKARHITCPLRTTTSSSHFGKRSRSRFRIEFTMRTSCSRSCEHSTKWTG